MTDRPNFWTVAQVAEFWCVTPRKVYRDISRGRLSAVSVAGTIRIAAREAARYGRECVVTGKNVTTSATAVPHRP